MQTVKEILQFIRALLGFLLKLKKKKPDVERKEPGNPEVFPDVEPGVEPAEQPEGIGLISGRPGNIGLVGGPFGNRPGVYRSPVDTLGVRTWRQTAALLTGWGVYVYALGNSLLNIVG